MMQFVFRIQMKSRNTRRDSRRDTGRYSVLETKKKWYGTLLCTLEGKWDSTAARMVERFKDTGHPLFKSISALSRGILKKRNNRDTIHFNADASNTELLFRIIHSVHELSIEGAASNWCEQIGLIEEEKGTRKTSWKQRIRDQRCIIKCEFSRIKTFGIFSQTLHLETVCGETFRTSNHCPRQFGSQGFANSHRSGTGYQLV